MLWLLSLPFALWNIMGTSMIPACLFISYVSISALHSPACGFDRDGGGPATKQEATPLQCEAVES